MNTPDFSAATAFVAANARVLDRRRFERLFEDGPAAPVRDAVAAYRAYRAAGGPETISEPADFSMAVAEQGHLLEFYARRALAPDESEENRSRARDRLSVMLGRPLTSAWIDALLAAL